MSKSANPILTPELVQLRGLLESHPVFGAIRTRAALRIFMQVHVFAVWDFMSLAKRLQRDLTCVSLPWMPAGDPVAARLINDIVLAEESDVDADGNPASHLELYLGAMREVGADTSVFEAFLGRLRRGIPLPLALDDPDIPECARRFVLHTLDIALNESTLAVMTSFLHGRESVIPGMFQGLLDHWGLEPAHAPQFIYYLQRHIDLDSDSHGPAAQMLLVSRLAADPGRLEEIRAVARASLEARHALWDGTLGEISGHASANTRTVRVQSEAVLT